MEWIKVTDMLPEFNKNVFVFGGGNYLIAQLEAYRGSKISKVCEWRECATFDSVWFEVTHWAEIEPPKTENV